MEGRSMQQERPIQKLSAEVIGQIAAGEVVERPASAVKELVENCIDAGATAVTVELREGGIGYLRVSDNGRGIPASQIRMAFERHATSKIIRSEDLFDVHTLGFRGEALASIAAVSKVTCTTRTPDDDFGVRAKVEAGVITEVREAAAPVGTTLIVQDLFYNTPVRLKFLKKPAMEASLVADYMQRLILSRPDVSFRFVNQGKTVYQSVGDGTPESALFCVYGRDAMRSLRKVSGVMNGVVLDGYVGVGELARGNRQQQSFFVNGRYFRDGQLSKAVENACEGLVMVGRFPLCAIFLQVPYQQVDVNVHPNKLEVRFQNVGAVAQAVEALVRESLRERRIGDALMGDPQPIQTPAAAPVQVVVLNQEEGSRPEGTAVELPQQKKQADVRQVEKPAIPVADDVRPTEMPKPIVISALSPQTSMRETASPFVPKTAPAAPPAAFAPPKPPPISQNSSVKPMQSEARPTANVVAPQEEQLKQESLLPEEKAAALAFVGVAFQTYWLFENGERLLWVDQHAAHERILYDRLMARYENERISQRLLAPQLVHLTARECALIAELKPVLQEAGFDIEAFDESSVAVHAVPVVLGQTESVRDLLCEALDEWQSERGQLTRERLRRQVMQMACKKAIKAGDKLSEREVEHLLYEMLDTGILPTCPHGRPIVVETARRELEKRFKRIQ